MGREKEWSKSFKFLNNLFELPIDTFYFLCIRIRIFKELLKIFKPVSIGIRELILEVFSMLTKRHFISKIIGN